MAAIAPKPLCVCNARSTCSSWKASRPRFRCTKKSWRTRISRPVVWIQIFCSEPTWFRSSVVARQVGANAYLGGIPTFSSDAGLILHSHRVRIDCFLCRDSFQSGQHAAVIVFIGLKSCPALLAGIVPGKTDEMLFRFG